MKTRREFLQISALASTAILTPRFVHSLGRNGLNRQGRKLVIIQLSGGNDGLNTFIPFENDIYYQSRPGLAINKPEVLALNDDLGLNPNMKDLKELYDQGLMTVINQVGYPNPDRSHFRSMDIWHSGSNSDEYWQTGWLGRYLDHNCQGCTEAHQIIELDDSLSLAVKGEESKAIGLRNAKQLWRSTQDPFLQELVVSYEENTETDQLSYLYKTLTETMSSADYIYEKSKVYQSSEQYPPNQLAKKLKQIAELIISDIDTQVFYVSLSGFDTHVRQRAQQDRLLKQYAEAMKVFVKDLKQNDRLDSTLIMTFSEFGRRVSQNASGGTDHGKANNLWLIGGKLKKPGIYNETPKLQNLDDGDVPYSVDFRNIYATLLDRWLEADSTSILQRKFKPMPII